MTVRKSLAWLFCFGIFLTSALARAASDGPTPPLGEYCPPGSTFDSVNCFFGKAPAQTTAFIYDGNFYHTPGPSGQPQCGPLTTFDQANCYLRRVPAGYRPFILENGWYVAPNPRFFGADCPGGTSYDGIGCLQGVPPAGRNAVVVPEWLGYGLGFDHFAFVRDPSESCDSLLAGSVAPSIWEPFCLVSVVPSTWTGFVQDNRWYLIPHTGVGPWRVFTRPGPPFDSAPVCRTDAPRLPALFAWKLVWADEFDTAPDNTACYTSNDQALCMTQFDWLWPLCAGQPGSYWDVSRAFWLPAQAANFGGLRNLNKCTWQVLDSYNIPDVNPNSPPVQNSFRPENIRIEDGVLKMVTRFHAPPASGYDCGRALNVSYNEYTKTCPFSGAMIQSSVSESLTQGNSPANSDPARRYTGHRIRFDANGIGRLEFRAMIKQIGHGAWPALWLFADEQNPVAGRGELDVLEYLGYDQGDDRQIQKQSATFGNALQSIHNWDLGGSQAGGIPISVGEWHTYRVEFENNEVRFYIDNCLRNRIKEGQTIVLEDGTKKPFRLPKNQGYTIIISNPASSAAWLPGWYRAETDETGTAGNGGSNFQPTEFHVDYVRYYVAQEISVPVLPNWPAQARTVSPSGGLQRLLKRPASPKSQPAQ